MNRTTKRIILIFAAIAIIFGFAVSGATLMITLGENPQGEYFHPETGAIEFANLLPLLLVNFIAAALFALAIEVVLYAVVRAVRR